VTAAQRYRHRITILRQSALRDADGRQFVEWVGVPGLTNIPAQVLTGPGREAIAAGTRVAEADLRVALPWAPTNIRAADRVLWDGVQYEITAAPEFDASARREVRLLCKLALGGGQP